METHYPYSRYLEETFGCKTYKLVVSSGLTCPTRDGTLSHSGCAFCDLRGSSSFFGTAARSRAPSIAEQLTSSIPAIRERFGARKFLAYFQSYSNTYGKPEALLALYQEALAVPHIEGLCIGTRPDCLPDEVLAVLAEVSRSSYVSIELGVQSFEDATLAWLARGHDRTASIRALERLAKLAPRVHVCAHLIFGSPTDSPSAVRDSARLLNQLSVRGAKPHQLMVLEGTELARRWRASPFPTLSLEEYASCIAEFIENLSPAIYLERLCATASHGDECLAPDWSRERWHPHNRLREYLLEHGCRQGQRLQPSLD